MKHSPITKLQLDPMRIKMIETELEKHASNEIWIKGKTNKPSRKSGVNYRAHHMSPAYGTAQFSNCLNEHFINLHLDFSPHIRFHVSHPCTFGYIDREGKERQYTPDKGAITIDDRILFIEVKPFENWVTNEWQAKLRFLRALFLSINCDFAVALDKDIKRQPRLSNLQLLAQYARLVVTADHINEVIDVLKDRTETSIECLANSLVHHPRPNALIYHLIFNHFLIVDLDEQISPKSPITLPRDS